MINLFVFIVSSSVTWRLDRLATFLSELGFEVVCVHVQFDHFTQDHSGTTARGLPQASGPCVELQSMSPEVAARLIGRLSPGDWIITNQPYDQLPLTPAIISSPARVAYVPYAFTVTKDLQLHTSSALVQHADVLFAESHWHSHYYSHGKRSYGEIVSTGYSSIFDLMPVSSRGTDLSTSSLESTPARPARRTIGWTPHWSGINQPQGVGLFLASLNSMTLLTKERPDITLMFRPHPLLRPYLARLDRYGELGSALRMFENLPNVLVADSDPPVPFLRSCDILINNSGSFLAEYSALCRPLILYGDQSAFPFSDLNHFGSIFSKASVWQPNEIDVSEVSDIVDGSGVGLGRELCSLLLRTTVPDDPQKLMLGRLIGAN